MESIADGGQLCIPLYQKAPVYGVERVLHCMLYCRSITPGVVLSLSGYNVKSLGFYVMAEKVVLGFLLCCAPRSYINLCLPLHKAYLAGLPDSVILQPSD